MGPKKSRGLRAEEAELWQRVARTAKPLRKRNPPKPTVVEKGVIPETFQKQPEKFKPSAFRIGSLSASGWDEPLGSGHQTGRAQQTPKMDRLAYRRLKQGKSKPEARIDLHGMTADAAHAALVGFVLRAHSSGRRLILVITGKGRPGTEDGPIPSRPGILRRSLPEWLNRPPLNAIVQHWTEAHLRHGGSGAFYVYLRRPR